MRYSAGVHVFGHVLCMCLLSFGVLSGCVVCFMCMCDVLERIRWKVFKVSD